MGVGCGRVLAEVSEAEGRPWELDILQGHCGSACSAASLARTCKGVDGAITREIRRRGDSEDRSPTVHPDLEEAMVHIGGDCDEIEMVRMLWDTTSMERRLHRNISLNPCPEGDPIEFRARCLADLDERPLFELRVNGSVVAEHIQLTPTFRVYRYLTKSQEPVISVTLRLETPGDSGLRGACEPRVADLDPDFGFRVRGMDLLPQAVQVCGKPWELQSAKKGRHRCVRQGILESFTTYAFETCVELAVTGVTGRELLDVYVNGFSTALAVGLQLSTSTTHFRFLLAPVSCTICNVVLVVGDSSADGSGRDTSFGVIVDKGVGLMVAGQDCLPSAMFYSENGPPDATPMSPQAVQAGLWREPGTYMVLPYRRSAKPLELPRLNASAGAQQKCGTPPPSTWCEKPPQDPPLPGGGANCLDERKEVERCPETMRLAASGLAAVAGAGPPLTGRDRPPPEPVSPTSPASASSERPEMPQSLGTAAIGLRAGDDVLMAV